MNKNFFGASPEVEVESDYMTQEEADALEQKIMNTPAPKPTWNPSTEQIEEVLQEEGYEVFSDEDLENDEELLTDVSLRLAQGRLYEMILKHDLFENVDAPAKAIANVQREIRQHIRDRLAVLLGIKPDTQVSAKRQDFPFTEMEVTLLKTLLVKLSNGATEKYKEVPAGVPKSNELSSVSAPKPQTIKPLSSPKPVQKIAVSKPEPKPAAPQQTKKLPSNPNRVKSKIEEIRELEADLDRNYKPLTEMTPEEKHARNVKSARLEALKKTPRPAHALPMPSADQANAVYQNMAHSTTQNMLSGPIGRGMSGK